MCVCERERDNNNKKSIENMVKPSKTMQPVEGANTNNLEKSGRSKTKAFTENSFHNYMARKINLQRKQFGLQLPPDPSNYNYNNNNEENNNESNIICNNNNNNKRKLQQFNNKNHNHNNVRFDEREEKTTKKKRSSNSNNKDIYHDYITVVKRLKRKYGGSIRKIKENFDRIQLKYEKEFKNDNDYSSDFSSDNNVEYIKTTTSTTTLLPQHDKSNLKNESNQQRQQEEENQKLCNNKRKDLFFLGVVVQVNGYTNPDIETIQRLLHKHGGDLEKYETIRVTHIIAEHLSTAKVKIYKKAKNPKPICYPTWITDSVNAGKLLPYTNYLINEIKEDSTGMKSIKTFFNNNNNNVNNNLESHKKTLISTETTTKLQKHVDSTNGQSIMNVATKHQLCNANNPQDSDNNNNNAVLCIDHDDDEDTKIILKGEKFDVDDSNNGVGHDHDAITNNIHKCKKVDDGDTNNICEGKKDDDSNNDVCIGNDDGDASNIVEGKKVDEDMTSSEICFEQNNFTEKNYNNQSSNNVKTTTAVVVENNNNNNNDRYIDGRIRTVGTDPNFLESFFAASRLSFIGSYKQRITKQQSPTKKSNNNNNLSKRGQKFIFHVDMDCFFASVVLRNFPQYKNKPVVISHHGEKKGYNNNHTSRDIPKTSSSECATCNYEARKYGIKKGMYLGRAKTLCPDLIILQYDFEGYEEVSEAVSDILEKHATDYGGYVEQVSCDESYVELRLEACDGKSATDVAAELAETIRHEIFDATQCTASIGVSYNKLLAKLGTDHVKPNKSYVVTDYKKLLMTLQLAELHGIGYRLKRKLDVENLLTVQDIWDMGDKGEIELCRILGPGLGKKIFRFCQGKDDRAVEPAERKTIGAECNYGVRFDGPYGVEHMVKGLCLEVEKRMEHVGVKGTKVTLKVKQRKHGAPPPPKFLGHGSCHNLSKSSDTEDLCSTRDWKSLYNTAIRLFTEMNIPKDDIRGMGIVVSKLTCDQTADKSHTSSKQSITNWFSEEAASRKCDQNKTSTLKKDGTCNRDLVLSVEDEESRDDSSVVEIVNEAESTPRNNALDKNDDDDFDVDLPALSQIHMSQVKELPSPLRRKIESKMESARTEVNESVLPTESVLPSEPDVISRQARYRQTDVKRMFRLAAVKHGQVPPTDVEQSVSLSQLEQLPLEMQLQVANDDQLQLGALSQGKKKFGNSRKKLDLRPEKRRLPVDNTRREKRSKFSDDEKKTEVSDKNHLTFESLPQEQPDSFFRENIQPLSVFMNENSNVGAEAEKQVINFLLICVTEDRLSDVSSLLRCIKHRKDAWSTFTFESIFTAVDRKVKKKFGIGLDKNWIIN